MPNPPRDDDRISITVREWDALTRTLESQSKEMRRIADLQLTFTVRLGTLAVVFGGLAGFAGNALLRLIHP